jgi:hypothetical protein
VEKEDAEKEMEWRRLGRAIYILGELNDAWLAEQTLPWLSTIESLHLLYHIGEALLTLSRKVTSTDVQAVIANAGVVLADHRLADCVVRGYACAVARECGGTVSRQEDLAAELARFLFDQAKTDRRFFRHEFWRRAHGSEAFSEISKPQQCAQALSQLFQAEETSDYGDYGDGDYRQAQSSLMKAALRSCDLAHRSDEWRDFLEAVFISPRVDGNGWACRHLERILGRWFSGPEHFQWLEGWSQSNSLGGERIRAALRNIAWLERG